MKLSTKGRYGVKAMVELAINHGTGPISIKTISERQNISENYLELLFSTLKKSGLVKSLRGAQGGYILAKEPKEIRISDIIDVLEGPVEIATCLDGDVCQNEDCCATRLLWEKIKNSIDEVMASITLQDIVDDNNRINNKKLKLINRGE